MQHEKLIESYFYEVWNEGNMDKLDELLTADYINNSPIFPNPAPGPAGLKPIIRAMKMGIPDLHYTIDELILTEAKAIIRLTVEGTHTGELFGIAPSGKKFKVCQINIEHIRDGRIHAHWPVTDELGMMRQLGIIV